MIDPRPYQAAAVDAVFAAVDRGDPSGLVVLPTGMGKTVVFGLVAQRWPRGHSGRILVLAHREELITQAADELAGITGQSPAIEMADQWATPAGSGLTDAPSVVVASVQSLCQPRRLARWPRDEFGLVVTDEAHHATSASYRRIYDHFGAAFRLGVTATPKRADEQALGQVFGSVLFDMGICDAVDEGWLCPVEQRFVTVRDMDLSAVATEGGDFSAKQLGTVLTGDDVLDQMVVGTVDLCGSEPTLVFTAPRPPGEVVSQGDLFADALNKIKPESAVFLSGETERGIRRREIEQFELGHRQFLVGCSLFTEGFNVPKIARIVMARPTKSNALYAQMLGRGTRTLRGVLTPALDTPQKRQEAIAASKKPSVLVIDFVGNSGRHKVMSAIDIFAGKMEPNVVARAKKKAEVDAANGLLPRCVQDLIAEAAAEEKAERERMLDRERRRKEHKARVRVNRVDMHQESISPYGTSDGGSGRAATRSPTTGRASAGQVEWIREHGGYCDDAVAAEEAGRLIADIKDRWSRNQCSPKQERTLRRAGLADGPVSKTHAKALLDWLAARQWKPTGRPHRGQLSIVRVANGLSEGFQLTIDGVRVGGVFGKPADVRQVYAGLALEPQPQTA